MQQSKTEHISEQEAKEQLEKQAGLLFEYAHAQYNKNLRQWSFAVKNKAGAVVFSAVSFKDFAPYRALARHLNTSFEEVLDRYVFVYGAQHECGQGKNDERYCLTDKGWLKVSDIEEAFVKKFGQYRKDYEMHDELWVLTIDRSECSSATYKKHPKPGWPPKAERAAFALEELESQILQLPFDAFLTPIEQPLSTSDKEPSPEQPQTAPHSQKPVQPTEPAVSNTDTGKPKKQNEPSRAAESAGSNTGKQKKQNEHEGSAKPEHGKSRTTFTPSELEAIRAGTLEVEVKLPNGITVDEQGDADDLYNTAINYQYGSGGLKKDEATALKWYRKAADADNAAAMNMMGRYYDEGWGGLKKDEAAALEWYRKAADKGYAAALYNLAICYADGSGGLKADKAAALEWYRKAADKGHAAAMYEIGTYYSKGLGGLKKDEVSALEWFRKAADAGNADALKIINRYDNKGGTVLMAVRLREIREFLEMFDFPRRLGLLAFLIYFITLLYPLLIINDTVKAFKYYDKGDKVTALTWFRKAADKGHTAAMNMIGRYYEEGWGGLKQDKAAALEWLRKAADAGNEGSMNEIAEYYEQGKGGLKKDEAAALEWYRKAADVGDADAMVRISKYYVLGLGGLKKDEATALEWFRKSGLGNLNRTDSNSQVMYKIAKYYDAQLWDQATALEWFRKAADAGNADAMYNLAIYYADGSGGLKADQAAAVEWYRKAADADNAAAMNMMGRYYDEGWGGLKKDEAAALEWYRKAADKGYAAALYNLAICYADGSGGLKADKAAALEWYRKAADKGHAAAMYEIGTYYSKGLGGLKKDEVSALEWFRKAADKGNVAAMELIIAYYSKAWERLTKLKQQSGKYDANPDDAAAMNKIAKYYEKGWGGLKQDETAALEWYRKAADIGHTDAMNKIAEYYEQGKGGLKADEAAALEWYHKLADEGYTVAMNKIAEYYRQGRGGLKEDTAAALEWYRKSADEGNAAAAEMVKELETHTATDKSTAIGNRKKASIYFKKIFRFDRYWAISLIIYLVGSVSELIRSFFDSDTAKKRFFILSSVSITAFGLLILYSALTFYAMYI